MMSFVGQRQSMTALVMFSILDHSMAVTSSLPPPLEQECTGGGFGVDPTYEISMQVLPHYPRYECLLFVVYFRVI